MSLTNKKFMDQGGTTHLWSKIQQELNNKADSSAVTAINTKLGSLPEGQTNFASWISSLETGNYDDTALAGRVSAVEGLVTVLNGTATTEGSVAKTVADELSKIVNDNNNGNIDTLNEIAAWITNDQTGAAKMASDIQTLNTAKHTHSNSDALNSITTELIAAWNAKQNAIAANTYDAYGSASGVYNAIIALTNAEIDSAIAAAKQSSGT